MGYVLAILASNFKEKEPMNCVHFKWYKHKKFCMCKNKNLCYPQLSKENLIIKLPEAFFFCIVIHFLWLYIYCYSTCISMTLRFFLIQGNELTSFFGMLSNNLNFN